jgi:hypothetical protein
MLHVVVLENGDGTYLLRVEAISPRRYLGVVRVFVKVAISEEKCQHRRWKTKT